MVAIHNAYIQVAAGCYSLTSFCSWLLQHLPQRALPTDKEWLINHAMLNRVITFHCLLLRLLGLPGGPLGNPSPRPALLGLGLIGKGLRLRLLALHSVNSLKENALVLKLVTLGVEAKGVVDVLVDLLGVAHLVEETAEDADAAHPHDLEGETGVGGTATLTDA